MITIEGLNHTEKNCSCLNIFKIFQDSNQDSSTMHEYAVKYMTLSIYL